MVGSLHNPHLQHPNLRTDCKNLYPLELAHLDNGRFDHNLVEAANTGSPAPVEVEFLTLEDTWRAVEEVEHTEPVVEDRKEPVQVERKEPVQVGRKGPAEVERTGSAVEEVENKDKPGLGERRVAVDGRLALALDFDGLEHIHEELEPELEELAVRSGVPRREQRVKPHADERMAPSCSVLRRGFRVRP